MKRIFQTLLNSNPFLRRDFQFIGTRNVYLVSRREEWCQIHPDDDKGVVTIAVPYQGQVYRQEFAPTDTQGIVEFLANYGYFTGA
jgi:hypothetical protein